MKLEWGPRTKLTVSALISLAVALGLFGTVKYFNPWHSGLLNLASLAGLILLAALATVFLNFSRRQIKDFAEREKLGFIAAAFCLFFFTTGAASISQSVHLSKTNGEAITYDEVSLLPNGYYYLANGQYFLNPEHPPLIKLISAAPFYLMHLKQPKPVLPKRILLQPYTQFYWGKTFLFESGNNAEKMIFAARMSVLFVNTILIFALFLTLAYLWSRRAGLITTALITTSQFLIAHGSLSTLDFMSGVLTILALCWFGGWLSTFGRKKPAKLKLATTAVFLAAALLAKFSTALLLPTFALIGGLYLILNWPDLRQRRLKLVGGLALIFTAALALIVITYAPLVRNMTSADLGSQLSLSYDTTRLPKTGLNLLKDISRAGVFGRAFSEYANGLLLVNNRIYAGAMGVYFRGSMYGAHGAGWTYFPILYLAKLQITYHLLSLAALVGGLWFMFKQKLTNLKKQLIANPIAAVVLIYCLAFGAIALLSTLQIGLRHFMPVIPGMMVLTAIGLDYLLKILRLKRSTLLLASVVVTICLVGSAIRSYPYYLSYYNALAGDTRNGYKVAVDSNYDWGQDLKRLAKWQQDNNVPNLHFDMFIDPYLPTSYYLGTQIEPYNIEKGPPLPAGAYLAVSANQYELNTHRGLPQSKQYSRYDEDMVARVGTTIFIYKIPAQ